MPFTTDQFFEVFRQYNEAVWPAQLALLAIAMVIVISAARHSPRTSRTAFFLLAFLWAWMGIAYHVAFFARINPAAYVFGVLCVAEAVLLAALGTQSSATTRFAWRAGPRGMLGGALVAYALLAYPVIVTFAGHRYPALPTFGLPCPTTLFTVGVLLWVVPAVPRRVLIVPLLWSLIGASAAISLGVVADAALAAAAAVMVWMLVVTPHAARGARATPVNR